MADPALSDPALSDPAPSDPAPSDPSTGTSAPVVANPAALPPPSRRWRLGLGGWLAVVWLVLVAASSLAAPWLPIPAPDDYDAQLARAAPSLSHPFGGDTNGKDVLALTIHGGRASLLVGFVAVLAGMIVGGGLGTLAGYFRGRTDGVLAVLFDSLLGIPPVLFSLVLVGVFDPLAADQNRRLWAVTAALGVVSVPILGRIARASTLTVAQKEFVLASRAMGAKPARILRREVIPNVLPALLAVAMLGVGVAIVAEGGLALLGAGVSSPKVSWGSLIAGNRSSLSSLPWPVFGPCIFLFLTVLACNQLGEVIRRGFDVRESVL